MADERSNWKVGNRYIMNIEDALGGGRYGIVYRGRELATDGLVAVKHCILTDDDRVREYIIREIHNQKRISSPYVAKILYYEVGSEAATLVMEFCGGPTLFNFLRTHGPLGFKSCWRWMDQLLKGLNCAWTQGILHRDIKGKNIMLTENSPSADLKIVDFGVSNALSSVGTTGIGSSYYMAPELAEQTTYDQKVDVWSLGIVFYEMSVGPWPYPEEAPDQEQITTRLQDLPTGLRELLQWMIVIDPAHRIDHNSLFLYFQLFKYDTQEQISETETCSVWSAVNLVNEKSVGLAVHPLQPEERERPRNELYQDMVNVCTGYTEVVEYFEIRDYLYLVVE